MAIEPDERQLQEVAAIATGDHDAPVVMLNLNRYRERAAYDGEVPGGLPADVTGLEAYMRYGIVAAGVIARVGGEIAWHSTPRGIVIGEERDTWDEVIAVRYPSYAAFLALVSDPELLGVRQHRVAALERAAVLCCPEGGAPREIGVPRATP
jgi:uncharacterized protein (DUF1330 family)